MWWVKYSADWRSATCCQIATEPVVIVIIPCHNVWTPAAGRGSCGSWPSSGGVALRWPDCAVGLCLSHTGPAQWSGLSLQHLRRKQTKCLMTWAKKPQCVFFRTQHIIRNSTKFIWRQDNSKGVLWWNIPSISSPEKMGLMWEWS